MPEPQLEVDGWREPLARVIMPWNTVFIDAQTGLETGRIFRGEDRLFTAETLQPHLPRWASFPQYVPGSLCQGHPVNIELGLDELGTQGLCREMQLMERGGKQLQSAIQYGYNSAITNHPGPTLMAIDQIMIRLAEMRVRQTRGELSTEELREALKLLRQHRVSASAASAGARAAKAPVDTAAILRNLMGGG